MKIAHITVYPPKGELHCKKSGVAPYTKNLITNIPFTKKDEVFVICDMDDSKKEIYVEDNIKIHRVFERNNNFYKEILKEIDEIKPEKVHIQQELSLYGWISTAILLNHLIKKLKKKSIEVTITFHGIVDLNKIDKEFIKENFTSLPPFLVKTAFKIIYFPLIKNVDKIIVHEELFKNRIVNQYKWKAEKVNVIHHGIENFEIKSKKETRKIIWIDEKRKMLLFMWYITWYKWIDLLIEWFEEYIKTYDKNAILYVLWAYHPKLKDDEVYLKEYNRLRNKAKDKLWKSIIRDSEFVDWKKMSIYYPASDVVLFPYTRSLSSSWPMAVSIGYEIPFLASDVFRESISNDLFLFERNPKDMAKKIDYFFSNQDKYIDTIKKMREERLWDKVGELTYNVYSK